MTTSNGAGRIVVLAGASGVVGRHVAKLARQGGWHVRALTRHAGEKGGDDVEWVGWAPDAAERDDAEAIAAVVQALDGADYVVNLAGATLAEGRLGEAHRARVLDSRVHATGTLVAALRLCDAPPPAWFQASAVGYYGDTGEAVVDEQSPRGDSFLADVCEAWESTAKQLAVDPGAATTRLLIGRIGLVLARDAPAWQKMLGPIKWGVGGPLGNGRQWYAWIDADDLARAILYLADDDGCRGAFNMTAPEPVRQIELTKQAAKRLGRPAFMPAPAFVLKAALGGVASELLLPSCRAVPAALQEAGFTFTVPDLPRQLEVLFEGGAA